MKKIFSLVSVFVIGFMFWSSIYVKAENVYKAYTIGEEITAQVDKSGHKGKFIVIEDSDTKSDEVVVIQKNGGLDDTLKALGIKYEDGGKEKTVDKLAVNNATIRFNITFGDGQTDKVLDVISEEFNGYIRTEKGKVFGVMPYEGTGEGVLSYTALVNKYGQEKVDKVFEGQNYWINDGADPKGKPQFLDGDIYTINGANNSLDIKRTNGSTTSYVFEKFGRIINKEYRSGNLTSTKEAMDVLYEPAIMITLCKKNIVVPNNPNPPTADMNIIMLSIVGLLSLGVIVLTTKKIVSIK